MKYCKKCKHIHNDGEQLCSKCKKTIYEISDENTPVFLCSASGFELSRIRAALEDNGVPCDAVTQKKNICANAVTGYDTNQYDLLVPYSAYENAYDICVGIGVFGDDGAEIIGDKYYDSEDELSEENFEVMNPAVRRTVRILSAILLIAMFCIVIWGVDAVLNFFKELFF